jgi:hypothetical protein
VPSKDSHRISDRQIEDMMRRRAEGESVAVLAKFYGYSKPNVYRVIADENAKRLIKINHADMSPAELERADVRDLVMLRDALKRENTRLRKCCIDLIVKHGAWLCAADT